MDDFTDEGSTILQNLDNYLPLNMESNSKTVFINMTVTTSKLTKEKLLFMNGCECKSPASTTGILKLVPRRDNLVCLGL